MITAVLALTLAQATIAQPPIRIWGPPAMQGMAERWAAAYRKLHPDSQFILTMKGSDSAIPGLYGQMADISLMGREDDLVDQNGFTRTMGYAVTRVAVASGSVAVPGKSDAVAVLVNAANPIKRLDLRQLRALIDCPNGKKAMPTWGSLGLGGKWARRRIKIFSYDFSTRTGIWIQHQVANDSRKMCWDRITEFADRKDYDGTLDTAARQVGRAARTTPSALAIANAGEAYDGLKLVPLSNGNRPAALPDRASIIDGRFPLARRAFAFVAIAPGKSLEPRLAAFLDWVLSPQGQKLIDDDRGYLPLDPALAQAGRSKLKAGQ